MDKVQYNWGDHSSEPVRVHTAAPLTGHVTITTIWSCSLTRASVRLTDPAGGSCCGLTSRFRQNRRVVKIKQTRAKAKVPKGPSRKDPKTSESVFVPFFKNKQVEKRKFRTFTVILFPRREHSLIYKIFNVIVSRFFLGKIFNLLSANCEEQRSTISAPI